MVKLMHGLYSFSLIFITAMLGKYFTFYGLEYFYDTLDLPMFTPQRHYFSIAWGINYFLLFFSFYLVLNTHHDIDEFHDANILFVLQLFLQVLWTFSFFYMEQIYASIVVIVALDVVVMLMMYAFLHINKVAFFLLIPFLIWILFATYLGIGIALIN